MVGRVSSFDLHPPLLGPPDAPCSACRSPLASDQRYCLHCGERRGPARLDPVAMAGGSPAWRAPARIDVDAGSKRWASPIAMPGPRAVTAAALLVLGFGIFAGASAGPRAARSVAAAKSSPLVLVAEVQAPAPITPQAKEAEPVHTADSASASEPADVDEPPDEATSPTSGESDAVSADSDADISDSDETPPASDDDDSDADAEKPTVEPAAPPIKHVWVVMLTGHTFAEALAAPSPMPYLSQLVGKGMLLPKYAAVARSSLGNGVALVAGRKPTADQESGCPTFTELDLQARTGCVFGPTVKTLPGLLTAQGRTWYAYVEDSEIGSDPPSSCRHPAIGAADPWAASRPGDNYLTQRNPFVYFHEIIDGPDCGNLAPLSRVVSDAGDVESAPNVSFIVPNACHDGRDAACLPIAGQPAPPAGLPGADAWLQATIAPLLASPAYADDGAIVITFDHGPDVAPAAPPTDPQPVGALVLSKHVEAGATSETAYTHTDLLRTIEDAFTLKPIGASALPTAKPFGDDVFEAPVTNRSR